MEEAYFLEKITNRISNNGSILSMNYNYFNKDSKPSIFEFENLFLIIKDYNSNDLRNECYKHNLQMIIFYVMADTSSNSENTKQAKIFDLFTALSSKKLKELKEFPSNLTTTIATMYFVILLNKAEFLFKYNEEYVAPNNFIGKLRDELKIYHDILIEKGSFNYIKHVFLYYSAVLFYLEKNMDLAYSELLNLQLALSEDSVNINSQDYSDGGDHDNFISYLGKKTLIIQTYIENYRQNVNIELDNLKSLHTLPASTELIIKVALNIADCYYAKKEINLLNFILNETNYFLKAKSSHGNNNISNFFEILILTKLRMLYCNTLLYYKSSSVYSSNNVLLSNTNYNTLRNCPSTLTISYTLLSELGELFGYITQSYNRQKSIDDIKTGSIKTKTKEVFSFNFNPGNNSQPDKIVLKKLYTNYQLHYIYYKRIYNEKADISFINEMIKENKSFLSNCPNDYLLNLYVNKQNDLEINKYYGQILSGIMSKYSSSDPKSLAKSLSSTDCINNLFFIYNKIVILIGSLVTDTSNSMANEYIKEIVDLSKKGLSSLTTYNVNGYNKQEIQNSYMKTMIGNIFYSFAYAMYHINNYEEAKKIIKSAMENNLFDQPIDNIRLKKLRADIAFKDKQFKDAINFYLDLLTNKEIDCQTRGIINFNVGMCFIQLKDFKTGKDRMKLALENFNDTERKSIYIEDSCEEITSILDCLSEI